MVLVQTFAGFPATKDGEASGELDNNSFSSGSYIFDNAGKLMGSFNPGDCDNDEGIPDTGQENFLHATLTGKPVNLGVGKPYFSFNDGNGVFGTVGCACHKVDTDVNAAKKA